MRLEKKKQPKNKLSLLEGQFCWIAKLPSLRIRDNHHAAVDCAVINSKERLNCFPNWDCTGRGTEILSLIWVLMRDLIFLPLEAVQGQTRVLLIPPAPGVENKMNKSFTAWAKCLEGNTHFFMLPRSKSATPPRAWDRKIITLRACESWWLWLALYAFFFLKAAEHEDT